MLKQSHQDFSDRLRKARLHAGFKGPADAADAHRWNKNTYKSRENGLRGIPDHEDVRDLAKAFNVPFLWLLAGEGEAPPWELSSPTAGQLPVIAEKRVGKIAMPDNANIQVFVGDLRILVRDSLRIAGVPTAQAKVCANAVIEVLQAQSVATVVHRLTSPVRIDPESPLQVFADRE